MMIRSFLLCESFDRSSNGLVLKSPFSIISFDEFPTSNFGYAINISFEGYSDKTYKIDLRLYDPTGKIYCVWNPYDFKGSPNKEARGVIYNHSKMVFKMPGTYRYEVLVDDQVLGEYTLVVLNKKQK